MAITKLQNKATYIYNHLKPLELKDGGTRIIWKDKTAESVREWFLDATSSYTGYTFSELDECYTVLNSLAGLIVDQDAGISEDALIDEICRNDWAYDSNADCLDWVKESLGRLDDVNTMLSESGANNVIGAIQDAMNRTRIDIALSFLESIKTLKV